MTWQEFVSALDTVRSEIRATKNLKENAPDDDLIYKKLHLLLEEVQDWDEAVLAPRPVEQPTWEPIDVSADLAACVSDDEPADLVVERGEGEGRMVVERRKTPLVVRPPELIEVTEKELGK